MDLSSRSPNTFDRSSESGSNTSFGRKILSYVRLNIGIVQPKNNIDNKLAVFRGFAGLPSASWIFETVFWLSDLILRRMKTKLKPKFLFVADHFCDFVKIVYPNLNTSVNKLWIRFYQTFMMVLFLFGFIYVEQWYSHIYVSTFVTS